MNFDMEKLIKRPLIDNQAFYVDDIPALAENPFADLHSENTFENTLSTSKEKILSIYNRTEECTRLMNANGDITETDEEDTDESKINIDRYLQRTIDHNPPR